MIAQGPLILDKLKELQSLTSLRQFGPPERALRLSNTQSYIKQYAFDSRHVAMAQQDLGDVFFLLFLFAQFELLLLRSLPNLAGSHRHGTP